MKLSLIAVAALATTSSAFAASTQFDQFTPLASNVAAGSLPESAPFQLANPNWTQVSIADRTTQLGLGESNSGNWDMITANESGPDAGRYLFAPFETSAGGVQRTDLVTGVTKTIVNSGTQGFVAGDASRWTPWGSYLTAEESWGTGSTKGRLFEVTNPVATTDATTTSFLHRSILPRVSHEGLAFDKNNNLYFIDELNGGSIYKYVSANPNASNGNDYFAAGQTFVAAVNGGGNANATGAITWRAISDVNGGALAGVSTLAVDGSIDGRITANTVGGTDYQRPEDLEVQVLGNGDEVLYIATTTTNEVYSFNLATNEAKRFLSRSTLDEATGMAVGSALTSPDNLAIDAEGNIYVIEDQPGGQADIWFARDADKDGVAESMARWASMSTVGAEPTGLYFDKTNPNVAYVNVQHPSSGVDRLMRIDAVAAVPEPESYAMVLAGLSVMGLFARRRRQG